MECYDIPATPERLLLPIECVAEVLAKPQIVALKEARTNWMRGHATWRNQRIPVISYSALHDANLDESKKRKAHLVVLNPVPDSVRKAYTGLLCFGNVKTTVVNDSICHIDLPTGIDRRYVDAVVRFDNKKYLIPRLAALAVAFSYF